jgi:hypothetical protein
MWDLNLYYIYFMFTRKKLFFQCGIWNLLLYILYVYKKKSYVFSMWDKNTFLV